MTKLCPECEGETRVADSRSPVNKPWIKTSTIWRKRICKNCNYCEATHEISAKEHLRLVENDAKLKRLIPENDEQKDELAGFLVELLEVLQ